MGKVSVRNLEKADDTRTFPHGVAEMVTIEGTLVGRARFEPGWRWSEDVKPIAGTERCMILHKGYVVAGSLVVKAEDGSETTLGAGDAYVIEPGHDAWVQGDEQYVAVDFSEQMAGFAQPS